MRKNILKSAKFKSWEFLIKIIDLSGVEMVDTMVAHQTFQVMSSLKLISVKSTLLEIRSEVAQTAVQLWIGFKEIITENSLKKVRKKLNI